MVTYLVGAVVLSIHRQILQSLPHFACSQTLGNFLALSASDLAVGRHEASDSELALMRQADFVLGVVARRRPATSHAQLLQPPDRVAIDFPLALLAANGTKCYRISPEPLSSASFALTPCSRPPAAGGFDRRSGLRSACRSNCEPLDASPPSSIARPPSPQRIHALGIKNIYTYKMIQRV